MSEDTKDMIVISGISGRFPASNNISEFSHKLYNKIDMTDEDENRWKHFHPEVPLRTGKIQNLEKFDASFFSILDKSANTMDPQMRCLLEHCYEAIVDAGMSPQSLVGSKTGVFIGNCYSDSKDAFFHRVPAKEGLILSGNANFYISNRISYALGLCGPSMTLDTACSSSAYALDCAFKYIMSGACDAAIVGGSQLILNQMSTIEYSRHRILAPDGEYCRPFDEKASGFTRADTICVVFLQRKKDSKRVYAELLYTNSNNDGYKKEGSTFPSRVMQQKLMEDFFKDSKIDPNLIDFVEAHSTGTRLGDPEEVAAIDEVYCKNRNRTKPLAIGSVKSNMGHAEASSGVASIAKILLALESHKIAPNINLTKIRSDIEAFAEKRIRVVTDVEALSGPYISMNSFGLGGANVHALFHGNLKEKINHGIPADNLDRMVLWTGRTENAVNAVFDEITKRPLDVEFTALLNNSQTQTNPANIYRGFGIFKQDQKSICVKRDVKFFNEGEKRKMVWVYSGIGSQWAGMGDDLMKIPIFAETINECHEILSKKGVDLKHILTSKDKSVFENIFNSYIGIIAIEIALTNVLKALGLNPDYVIGHSLGEMGCSYSDGCWTAEETILAAHARAVASCETQKVDGAMAAIGLNYKEIEKTLPSTIDIACHNSVESTTISGKAEEVRKYVEELKKKNIFAKEIDCSGFPLHSRYITKMGKNLHARLKEVIKNPKKRSEKWLSTSYSKESWINEESQLSSAEYHTKNLLNPVLFEEVMSMLPKNAITIEIAPHALLNSILKQSMTEGVHFSLTRRNCDDGCQVVMESLGRLFQNGIDLDINRLFPSVDFPVSRGTPMISPIIKWNHEENYFVPYFDTFNTYERRNILISLNDKSFELIKGHVIDGKTLFPGTGWIYLVWETFGMMLGVHHSKLKVAFEEVKFLRATSLNKDQDVLVTISIHRGSGRFEIVERQTAIANGYIKAVENVFLTEINVADKNDAITFQDPDFYKELRLRGYFHQGLFRAVKEIRDDGLTGLIQWNNEWITFIDCLIQFQVLMKDTRMLILPTSMRKLVIDPIAHQKMLKNDILLQVKSCPFMEITQCGGVEIHGFEGSLVNRRRSPTDPVLEIYKFIPFNCQEILTKLDIAKILVQLSLENSPSKKLLSIEFENEEILSENIYKALSDLPVITPEVHFLTQRELKLDNVNVHDAEISTFSSVNLVIGKNLINDKEFYENSKIYLHENCFIVSIENDSVKSKFYDLISTLRSENSVFHILKVKKPQNASKVIKITQNVSEWLQPLRKALENETSVIAYSNDSLTGVLGLVNCIRKEPNGEKLKCFLINSKSAPEFNFDDDFYKSQLSLDLVVNVYQDNSWGTFRHLKIEPNFEVKSRTEHCFANCVIKGDLSTFSWFYGPYNTNPPKDIIKISYSSLNFRDVMLATGKIASYGNLDRIDQQCIFGCEYSGMFEGRRVMAMGPTGCLATEYDASNTLLWDVPSSWTLEEAATVPLVYFTVYLAYFFTTKIERGKSILIHSGCGGVGLAAIQVAFSYGLEVFTTVGNDEKKAFLLSTFPLLKPENIGNSRDISFERMISLNTNGKGVDYVLNSLSEDKLQASIRCLGMNGVFLEIGKFDIFNRTKIEMIHLAKRIEFKAVFFDDFKYSNNDEMVVIKNLIADDIKAGIVKPIKINLFEASEIEQAFRFMASGKHIGKVTLKIRENPEDNGSFPLKMMPRVYCNKNDAYIIVGGLGGLGLELADWLVLRGCKKIVISSSRGVTNSYQASRIKTWKSYGIQIVISTANITTETGCAELFNQALEIGPVGGIFNLAVALRDGIFDNQTEKMFIESLAPKAEATKLLDKFSRLLCPSLKYFVVISSVSCGRGNAGQSNYGMANSVMEAICEERHKLNLPAKAIQFGAIGDVGLLAMLQEKNMDMEISGTLPQRITSCLEVLDSLLTLNEPVVASMIVAEKHRDDSKKGNIIEVIMSIMAIRDRKHISKESSLSKLGMDSLMGVEILQVLERDFDLVLSTQELRSLTLGQLEKLVVTNKSKNVSAKKPLNIEKLLTSFGDEKTSSEIILKLNGKSSDRKILIIPGFEGMASENLFEIAEKFEFSTYALQLASTVDEDSLETIFEGVKNHVLNFFKSSPNFTLIGYSFGSLLTLKLANFLEISQKTGKIFIIDGSPKFIQKISNQLVPTNFTDENLQELILVGCTKLLFGDSAQEIGKKIFSNETLETRLEAFLTEAKSQSEYSIEYGRRMIKGLFNRFKISLTADEISFEKVKSNLKLIKPSEISLTDIEDDYELSKFAESEIEIKIIEGDHLTILNNFELVQFINLNL